MSQKRQRHLDKRKRKAKRAREKAAQPIPRALLMQCWVCREPLPSMLEPHNTCPKCREVQRMRWLQTGFGILAAATITD